MSIHVLPPLAADPTEPSEPSESADPADPGLDPFWAAVRRRRPDLPLVLLGPRGQGGPRGPRAFDDGHPR